MIRACAAGLILGIAAIAAEPDPVVQAARLRQDQTKTLILEYRQVSRVWLTATDKRPSAELSTTADNRIVVDGNKVRVEDNNPSMTTGQGFSKQQRIEVFDGVDSRMHFPVGISPSDAPTAVRHERSPKIDVGLPHAIFLHFRAAAAEFQYFSVELLNATGRVEAIDGHNCLEYEHRKADRVTRCWFEPSKAHAARRIQSELNGRVSHRTSIAYRNDPASGWVPASWRIEDFNADGSPKYARDCEVTRLVVNGPVAASEFQLNLKPGTYLHDQETKQDFQISEDGTARELTFAEKFGSPQRTTTWQWIARHSWKLVLVASVLLLTLLPILIRRRTRAIVPQAG